MSAKREDSPLRLIHCHGCDHGVLVQFRPWKCPMCGEVASELQTIVDDACHACGVIVEQYSESASLHLENEDELEVVSTPKPGIYRGIDFDTYTAWNAYNASTLHGFRKTPAHVLYEIQTGGKARTPSLDLGWLLHLAVLEPERFESEFAVAPKVDKRTKAGKAAMAKFEAEHPEAQPIDNRTHSKVLAMKKALLEHPTAHEFFSGEGHNEVSILWRDPRNEADCKARIDRVSYENEWPVVGDLKIARDASRSAFERSMYLYGYHVQAAHYLEGLETIVPIPQGNPFRRFHFFVVEHEPPHCVAVYEIDDAALAEGSEKRDRYIQKWKECERTGNWHGYPDGVEYVSLPAWAFKKWEDIA